MNKIQKMIDTTLTEELPKRVYQRILIKKLKEKGIDLNEKQLAQVEHQLSKRLVGNISLDLTKEQEELVLASSTSNTNGDILIDINSSVDFESILKEMIENFVSDIPDLITKISDILLKAMQANMGEKLSEDRKQHSQFIKKLSRKWQKPFDLFEIYLVLAYEFGADVNKDIRETSEHSQEYLFEILTRLHARSCQIGQEVLTLLKNGFADGAHARWRTLYEIAVISSFIAENGEEIAYKYHCYDAIDCYKSAILYQQYCDSLNCEPLSKEEFQHIKEISEEMVQRFGKNFKNNYGWAATIIGKNNPTFRDIESSIDMDHMRSYYRMASNNVHANPRGVFFKLGLSSIDEDILLAGPSNTGFTDPASGAALAICQTTIALLTIDPNIDRLVESTILMELNQQIGEAFFQVEENMYSE